ncbi:MAG: hypothetical protein GY714_10430 [Desulfobacterales bacterium]|nr:hypothetical protein [Desulfobacterales bacterium]
MNNLTYEDGIVKVGGTELPGVLKSISVSGEIKWDDVDKENSSGSVKVPVKWDDADVSITMILPNDEDSDPYKKLKQINKIFKKISSKNDPKVYRVINRHLKSRGLSEVYFSKLTSRDDNKRDYIEVRLSFVEYKQTMSKPKSPRKTSIPKKQTSYLDNDIINNGIVEKIEWTEEVGE